MGQIFHPSFNTISRLTIFGSVLFLAAASWAWSEALRSPYVTQVGVVREQPVPFSHKHHVSDVGLDCRHCHDSVEKSAFAGLPSSRTCMSCHSQLFVDAEMLAPVRDSYRDDRSIPWVRVHDLPDFAYFHHGVHVAAAISCARCHGDVAEMPLTWRANTLDMEWCVDCHQQSQGKLGPLTSCSTCHR